jgi:hypothetical protein
MNKLILIIICCLIVLRRCDHLRETIMAVMLSQPIPSLVSFASNTSNNFYITAFRSLSFFIYSFTISKSP